MSDMQEKRKAQVTRTERELEAMGEGTKPAPQPKPKPKPKPKPVEKAGMGKDNTADNAAVLRAMLKKRLMIAQNNGDNALAAKLKAQLAQMAAEKAEPSKVRVPNTSDPNSPEAIARRRASQAQ